MSPFAAIVRDGAGREKENAMDGGFKIQVKIGSAEFMAEGSEETVKTAYEQFLGILEKEVGKAPAAPRVPSGAGENAANSVSSEPGAELLERVFSREGDVVSLRLMPPAENPNRAADAAILLLYGYRSLLGLKDVPVTKLNDGLRKSGVAVDRVDRFIGAHSSLFMRGGTRSGGRYTLNNQGINSAQSWLNAWFH